MRKTDAIARVQGRFAVLSSPSWGSYLCGPLQVVSMGQRAWRVEGPIVGVTRAPGLGKPFLAEGRKFEVGGANLEEDTIRDDGPELSFEESRNLTVKALVDHLRSERAACQEELEKALQDPELRKKCDVSFRNVQSTFLQLRVDSILRRASVCLMRARQIIDTCRASGFSLPEVDVLYSLLPGWEEWYESVNQTNTGPQVRV